MIKTCFVLFIICLTTFSVAAQFEGDICVVKNTGEKGRCILLNKCDYAKDLMKSKQRPQSCGFQNLIPIVCCPLTAKLIPGDRSEKKCETYYPRLPKVDFAFGGKKSPAKEFTHMAILGFEDGDNIQWLCGGSLISEQFVLTAAHCVISREFGKVKFVRLGDLDINSTTDDARPQNFRVDSHFVYPEYRSRSHYHDVGLLKLDRSAKFDSYVKPACLYPWTYIPRRLTATGWGKIHFLGETSSHLRTVNLNRIGFEQCHKKYWNKTKKLSRGILDEMQICASHPEGKDTCPGDSGGPLQFKAAIGFPHYYVVGITSFGKACGVPGNIGVYTRVAYYIKWIEDIVWPEK